MFVPRDYIYVCICAYRHVIYMCVYTYLYMCMRIYDYQLAESDICEHKSKVQAKKYDKF